MIIEPKRVKDEQRRTLRQLRWVIWLLGLSGLLYALVMPALFVLAPAAVAAAHAGVNPDVAPGCLDLVEGGNFEQFHPSWQIGASTRPPMYTSEQTFNNSAQAMRLGNGLELPNIESVSEVRHQPILLPYGATRIILRFLYYPVAESPPGADLQQADLFDATTDQLIGTLFNAQDDARIWKARDYDLTLYAGRTVSLRFRVRNDGAGGRTLMYIDNVELEYCAATPLPTLTPTPSATALPVVTFTPTPSLTPIVILPTPTPIVITPLPTPIPTVSLPPEDFSCPDILVNGNFESFGGWHFGEDPVPARYVNTFFQEGTRSVLLGNPPDNATNVVTFSSIRQLVTLPFTTGSIQLRWWRLPYTAQGGAATSTTDRQDLILLAPNLQPIQILRRELRNDGIWQEDAVDLTAYRGQTLYIYFNVFNDANNARTWMYLDNVRLRVCGAPVVAPVVTPIMTPIVTMWPPVGATPVAIPVTPNLTYTVIPMLTLSPLPFVTVTALPATVTLTPLPFPTSTETVAAAQLQPVLPTATPTVLATPTTNVYLLPTLPTQTVANSPTALAMAPTTSELAAPAAAPATNTPVEVVVVTPATSVDQQAPWRERVGAIAVMLGILVVIGFVVMAFWRMFQGQP